MDYQLHLVLVGRASKISVCEFLGRKKHADSGPLCMDNTLQVSGRFVNTGGWQVFPFSGCLHMSAYTCVLYTCVLGTDVSAENNHSNLQG